MSEALKLRALADAIDILDAIRKWMNVLGEQEQRLEHFDWQYGSKSDGNREVRRALIGVIEREWFALLQKAVKHAEENVAAGRAALEEG